MLKNADNFFAKKAVLLGKIKRLKVWFRQKKLPFITLSKIAS